MILSQRTQGLYLAGIVMFRVNDGKTRLFVSHAFSCQALVCSVSHIIIFASSKWANAVSVGCSEKFHKIIQRIFVMGYFLSKIPETF